jgi:2'-5' RNA ligase
MKQTVRTFVAIEINSAIRERMVELIDELRTAPADVKWVDGKNLHLTLKFLGNVPLQDIPQICRAVEKAAAAVAPYQLQVQGAGAFPTVRRPRTVWVGAGAGGPETVALHGQIEAALGKLGFRKEHRRFQPHLTIGRVRRSGPGVAELGQQLGQYADFDAGRMPVAEVAVISSQLQPTGPIYEALGRARLGGR